MVTGKSATILSPRPWPNEFRAVYCRYADDHRISTSRPKHPFSQPPSGSDRFRGIARVHCSECGATAADSDLFRLTQRDVCRATGYSKAFVSQLLAGKDFGAGERFWIRLNASLHDAVRASASNVFDVAPLSLPDDMEQIKEVLSNGARGAAGGVAYHADRLRR